MTMPQERILVVDDEKSMRDFLEILLTKNGYSVKVASSGTDAIRLIEGSDYDLVISDIRMPEMSGLELLRRIKSVQPETIVIMITAYASTQQAVEAMKEGAYDYLTKPFKVDEIKIILKNALDKRRLERENLQLKRELKDKYQFGNIIGSSPEMVKIYRLIERVALTRTNILISGESGTGKELVARAIHFNSDRRDKPFVTINCGAIPESLMESELFGHIKGAFTGALCNKMGLFETAHEGTSFLDEIGELPTHVQVKLLRAIQERTFRKVGGTDSIQVNVRIICATNKILTQEIAEGKFREDLYYRLNVIQIHMPPLRDRREDIPHLAQFFLDKYNKALDRKIRKITNEAMECLLCYHYPGNVRELENVIERCVALEPSDVILLDTLPDEVRKSRAAPNEVLGNFPSINIPEEGLNLEDVVEDFEKRLLLQAMERTNGIKKRAAELLNVSFRSFRYRLEKYGLSNGLDEEEDVDAGAISAHAAQ